jgi:long-chain fatty acid transport protein
MQPPAKFHFYTLLASAPVAVLASSVCAAGGLYLPHKGASGLALSNAGNAARANDASTVFSNPAGMTQLGNTLQFGAALLSVPITIDDAGSRVSTPGTLSRMVPIAGTDSGDPTGVNLVPNVYLVHRLRSSDTWLGLAVTNPFGLKINYPTDWFGRYDSIDNELLTLDIAPSFAYKINDQWSVGGGLDLQYSEATLSYALPNPFTPHGPTPGTDALSALEGDDWSAGFNLGGTWQTTETTRLGVHYRSQMQHALEGSLAVSGLAGPLAAFNGVTNARTGLNLPEIVSFSLARNLSPSLTLYLDAQWFAWDSFDEIRIEPADGGENIVRPQHFSNSWVLASGVSYRLNDRWQFSTGLAYDETPTANNWRNSSIPDGNKYIAGVGLAYNLSDGVSFDFTSSYARLDRVNINIAHAAYVGSTLESNTLTRGRTNNGGYAFSLSLRYDFGA